MGFPILSLIVTRIIGIPQSLLLRVVGIPQFSPWVYGIPHALLRLSPKAFSFIWISYFLSFVAFEGLVHWLDIGDTSRDIDCVSFFFQNSFLRGIHNPFLLLRNYSIFFEWTYASIDQDIRISPFSGGLATHSCSEELSNPFSEELTQLSTRIFERPLELDLLKNSKDKRLTKKKLGTRISHRQKRIPFPRPIPLRANCPTTGPSIC